MIAWCPHAKAALLRRAVTVTTAFAVSAVGLTGSVLIARQPAARADVVTASDNNLRDGWDPNEPGLSPAVLESGTFGQLFSTAVDGQVFAQPIVAGSTLVVATQNDYVYGLNAVTGAVRWSRSLGAPWPTATLNCTDVEPSVGVMSTPVYDPSTGTVYLVAEEIPPGADPYHPAFYMHALSARSGRERRGWPVQIQGTPVNDPTKQFKALDQWQRAGLLLLGGSVYVAFGSHCDFVPYSGYVVGINAATRAQKMWTDESGITNAQAGIWQGGGGLMSDGPGRIFFASGNGVSPAPGPGSSPPGQLGDSVVRLAAQAGGGLAAQDFFSPANAPSLDVEDADLGSGGPVGLPYGTSGYPNLLVQAGKDGRIFLLNRDQLGGRMQGPGGTDLPVSVAGPFPGEWGHPAAFGDTTVVTAGNAAGANDFVYYLGTGRAGPGALRALKFGLSSSGTPVLSDVANSATLFGYGSGSPVVTSNGADPSSALIWEVYSSGSYGTGVLEAYQAVPSASCTAAQPCTLPEVWSAPIGEAAKFTIPAIDAGRVYVGTADGHVLGFGSPDAVPLAGGAPVDFGLVPVGHTSRARKVTVRAVTTLTVNKISATSAAAPNPFIIGRPTGGNGVPISLPVTLRAGETLTVPVKLDPAVPGGITGAVDFANSSANFPVVSVALSGTGTRPGFYASPTRLDFAAIPVRTTTATALVITNAGTTVETVSSITRPRAPFTVSGLPGGAVPAGKSVTAMVTFRPTRVGRNSSRLVIRARDGTSLTVDLTGSSLADVSKMSLSPSSVGFGSIPVGSQATQTIELTNSGDLPATITATSPPQVPFGNPDPVPAGLTLDPGEGISIPVTLTPPSAGKVTGRYRFTWTDVTGTHKFTVTLTGAGTSPASGLAVPPPGGGWTFNGAAQMSGTALALTRAVPFTAGSAIYSVPQQSNGLRASFTVSISAGTDGDGMTLALLDASKAKVTVLGPSGAGLGWAGHSGIAVALVTRTTPPEPPGPFVGIATGSSGGKPAFIATSTSIPDLRQGTHTVEVSVSGQTITVGIDGRSVLSPTLPAGTVPPSVLVGFTASTGSRTDIHAVTTATITSAAGPIPPPGGGWSYNGTAAMNGSGNLLTPAAPNSAGSVVYPTPVNTAGLNAQFEFQLYGGNNGYGITFALLDPAAATATSLGAGGPQLGFGGLTGTAAVLVSQLSTGYPAGNFVAASAGTNQAAMVLSLQSMNRNIEPLRSGTHTLRIAITGADLLKIWLDGGLVIQQPERDLTSTALLAFTAGTGAGYQNQVVRDIAISAAG